MKKKFFVFLGMSILLALLLVGCTDGLADNQIKTDYSTKAESAGNNPINQKDADYPIKETDFPQITAQDIVPSDVIHAITNYGKTADTFQRKETTLDDAFAITNDTFQTGDNLDFFVQFDADKLIEAFKTRSPLKIAPRALALNDGTVVTDPFGSVTYKWELVKLSRYNDTNSEAVEYPVKGGGGSKTYTYGAHKDVSDNNITFAAASGGTAWPSDTQETIFSLQQRDVLTIKLTITWTYKYAINSKDDLYARVNKSDNSPNVGTTANDYNEANVKFVNLRERSTKWESPPINIAVGAPLR